MQKKILVIEDEISINDILTSALRAEGYSVRSAFTGNEARNIFKLFQPDIALLDINLPYYDGYYICREIRKCSNVPIIVVTSRQSEIDELMSMNLGADDFITKPYNTQILLARISSVLRRMYQNIDMDFLEFKGLKFNISQSLIEFNGEKIDLTKNESKILYSLIKNKEKIVSRNKLMDELWQSDEFVDDNTLTVNINRLRKKMESIGAIDMLQTKRGQGYILQ